MSHGMYMEVRGQYSVTGSLLPPYGSQGSRGLSGLVASTFAQGAISPVPACGFGDSVSY